MKKYLITLCIRDGEYEYYSTFQHLLKPELLEEETDVRDMKILAEVNGGEYEETYCGEAFQDKAGYDYRHYTVYSITEIRPQHQKILDSYGI